MPEKYSVLFDGKCPFCTKQSRRIHALARPGAVELVDFQQPGVLDRFPNLTHEALMQAMHLVTPKGQVYRGFEAIVQALATRPILRWPAHIYYLPGIRQLCDWSYRWVARNRYKLFGKSVASECPDGTC